MISKEEFEAKFFDESSRINLSPMIYKAIVDLSYTHFKNGYLTKTLETNYK